MKNLFKLICVVFGVCIVIEFYITDKNSKNLNEKIISFKEYVCDDEYDCLHCYEMNLYDEEDVFLSFINTISDCYYDKILILDRSLSYNQELFPKAKTFFDNLGDKYTKMRLADEIEEIEAFHNSMSFDNLDIDYKKYNGVPLVKMKIMMEDQHVFLKKWEKLKNELRNHNQIIFDLRDNPGGRLINLLRCLDDFFDVGYPILTIDYYKNLGRNIAFAKNKNFFTSKKIYILVNNNTASSAEFFSGVLQYYKKAKIIGEVTAGKFILLNTFDCMQTKEKIAFRLYVSIADVCFGKEKMKHDGGLKPDIVVKDDENIDKIIRSLIKI